MERGNLRAAAAWVFAGLGFVASYTAQRVWLSDAVDPKLVVATVHIPYFWRVALAAVQALAVGLLAWFLLDEAGARWWLARLPWVAPAVVLPLMAALGWYA